MSNNSKKYFFVYSLDLNFDIHFITEASVSKNNVLKSYYWVLSREKFPLSPIPPTLVINSIIIILFPDTKKLFIHIIMYFKISKAIAIYLD